MAQTAKAKVHRISVKAVLVHDEKLLAIRKADADGDYYLLPGGGQEHGETLSETLVREVREETGLECEAGDLLFVRDYIGANHEFSATSSHFHQVELYFSATLNSRGDLASFRGSVLDDGQTGVDWIPLDDVAKLRVYPLRARDWFRGETRGKRIYIGDVN